MHRKGWVLPLAALVLLALAAVAPAAGPLPERYLCLLQVSSRCGSRVDLTIGAAGLTPRRLPVKTMRPVEVRFRAGLTTDDGSVPSSLRTIEVFLDKYTAIDAEASPACAPGTLRAAASRARALCRSSIVGGGVAHVATDSPQPVALPLTFFNGGVKAGVATLSIWSPGGAAMPKPLLVAMKLGPLSEGRYGTGGAVELPRLPGSAGAVVGLSFRFKRGYLLARCFDGRLQTRFSTELADGMMLSGTLLQPCSTLAETDSG